MWLLRFGGTSCVTISGTSKNAVYSSSTGDQGGIVNVMGGYQFVGTNGGGSGVIQQRAIRTPGITLRRAQVAR